MAISTKRKNQIIAEWKAGLFTSYNAVAVHYKVDPKTVKKILDGISQSNADIVDVGAKYESAKKSIKNPNEIKAIEKAILIRTIADDIEDVALDGTLLNVKSVKKKIELEELNTMQDHKTAQETFDRALITAGKAPRHANTTINNTNATQNNESKTIIFKRIGDNG